MLSRRDFFIATGFCGLSIYGLSSSGCSRPIETPPSIEALPPIENTNHEFYAISEILGLFFNHPVVKGLSFLRILYKELREIKIEELMIERNKKGNELTVNLKTKNEGVDCTIDLNNKDSSGIFFIPNKKDPVYFSPDGFIRTNNISNENDLEYFDKKIQLLYEQCTDTILKSGAYNHMEMLSLRSECFQQNGYEQINNDYWMIKHEKYENI